MKYKRFSENPNYYICDNGEIFSLYTYKYIKHKFDKQGYHLVNLKVNGKTTQHRVHRLVAQYFIPNPDNLPQVNHKDEDKDNNCAENLEWCTAKYNMNYGTRNKRISESRKGKSYKTSHYNKSKAIAQLDLDGNIIQKFENCRVACEAMFPNRPHMRKAINAAALGRRETAGGYKWVFVKYL